MLNFADQCLDMARSTLGHSLDSINEDGSISPFGNETARLEEPGHAVLAMGEFYRLTNESQLGEHDLIDLSARCITAQAFTEQSNENGLAFAALGLLSFGASKDRNPIWERLLDPTREQLADRLLCRTNNSGSLQAFNVAKAAARFSMGLAKQDETSNLIDRFIEGISHNSSANYCDDVPEKGIGGTFDLQGILSFVFIRQVLQLHANINLRERKLPSLRTFAEKYIRIMPDIVRQDGLGWIYGKGIGAYGQMHCISIILQGMRDGWISEERKHLYFDILRRLFQFFFMTYLDQEQGFLVIRDEERGADAENTTRLANLDGARCFCQWARLARAIGGEMIPETVTERTRGRFVIFDKSNRKEQGVFLYQDTVSGLQIQVPLVGAGSEKTSDSLSFPHCPGIFDWPTDCYMPIMIPELTFGDQIIIPSYYGKRCVTGLGLRKSFYFRFEQPELITKDEKLVPGLGSSKVSWTFSENKVTSEFIFSVKNQVQMDRMRYVLAIAAPHSVYRLSTSYTLGSEGLRCIVLKDDFQASWAETEVVTDESRYKTCYGNIHYLQILKRDYPLIMRPGQQYRLSISFQPDIAFADE
ncbi:MAG: hypothetical protein DF168_01894 [Candidatus Moanabacter tarae]|uniref:Uncharacterized protein n=1 Tax=Candidatus Moanibacter tarae TaxID=2200854 RepID=A0A2Z4AHJ5_9BACT|nr:MAG: hypothetical protein DF168_01894 [Candidatus Moanabacter tarae]|tara:strand:+ start:10710 stop:12470 length:1761 start_codon:yes stop_codon:yes gene_type:complete